LQDAKYLRTSAPHHLQTSEKSSHVPIFVKLFLQVGMGGGGVTVLVSEVRRLQTVVFLEALVMYHNIGLIAISKKK